MKQLDLFTGKESDYKPNLTYYFSNVETPQDLDFLLSKLNVVEVGLLYLGDRMKKRPISPNYQGLCPFHKEKTPSFYLKPKQNYFKCYGCGEHGGPLKLDLILGNELYTTIAEKAKISDLLPFLSTELLISLDIEANVQQSKQEQQEYITVLRKAFQREQHY